MKSLSYRLNNSWNEEKLKSTELWAYLDHFTGKALTICKLFYNNTVCTLRVNHVIIFILYMSIESFLLDPEIIILASFILHISVTTPVNLWKKRSRLPRMYAGKSLKALFSCPINEVLHMRTCRSYFYFHSQRTQVGNRYSLGARMKKWVSCQELCHLRKNIWLP